MRLFAFSRFEARFILGTVCLFLAGCAGGDWPSLSDKLPDPQERVFVRGEPAAIDDRQNPEPLEDSVTLSAADAENLLHEVRKDLKALKTDYETAAVDYDAADKATGENTAQELKHAWLNTQLHLTRMSQTVSRLNAILFHKGDELGDVMKAAKAFKTEIDSFIAGEKAARPAPKSD